LAARKGFPGLRGHNVEGQDEFRLLLSLCVLLAVLLFIVGLVMISKSPKGPAKKYDDDDDEWWRAIK
jgi:hypothetical protein